MTNIDKPMRQIPKDGGFFQKTEQGCEVGGWDGVQAVEGGEGGGTGQLHV